jgi:hypothetical protein
MKCQRPQSKRLALRYQQALKKPFVPPLDMRDLYTNFTKWQRIFAQCSGLLLLLVAMKMPSCRNFFAEAFSASKDLCFVKRAYEALVIMAEKYRDPMVWEQLRFEIDSIKGPMYVHGMCLYLQKLGIVARTKCTTGLRLGAGKAHFVICAYSPSIRRSLQRYLDMSTIVKSLKPASRVRTYAKNESNIFDALDGYKPIQMGSHTYNRSWVCRGLQLGMSRASNIERLQYRATDTVRVLPGPDRKQIRESLG